MGFSPLLITILLASSAAAKICKNVEVPFNVSARTGTFNIPTPISNSDATTFIQNLTRQGQNFTQKVLAGYKTTAGTYYISTQFCTPNEGLPQDATAQILTHGLGFDKSYWDLPYHDFNYSYVDVATDQYKYVTLSYDRLGLGDSTHGDPVNEIQASLEVALLAEITVMLREGKYPGAMHPFKTVTHVGHSFGSALTYALVDSVPTISDGIALTGFTLNSSFTPFFIVGSNFVQANLNQPFRFGNISDSIAQKITAMLEQPSAMLENASIQSVLNEYDLVDLVPGLSPQKRVEYAPGYLTDSNTGANQYLFFLTDHYDPQIVSFAERTKQPITPGELLTLGSAPPINAFQGPVLVLTGSDDLPFCGGDCLATGNSSIPSIPATVKKSFPKLAAENFTAYIQPNTGHGINLHYNATGAYKVINTFFNAKELESH